MLLLPFVIVFDVRLKSGAISAQSQTPSPLPDIYVCPYGKFNRTKMALHDVNEQMARLLNRNVFASNQIVYAASDNDKSGVTSWKDSEAKIIALMTRLNVTLFELIEMLTFGCAGIFQAVASERLDGQGML